MRLEHHLVGGYVRYISPYIIIIYYYYYAVHDDNTTHTCTGSTLVLTWETIVICASLLIRAETRLLYV